LNVRKLLFSRTADRHEILVAAAPRGVESHPYLPEWELLDFCRVNGIVLLAFAPLGHAMQPNLLEDNVITDIASRLQMSPAQVALSWATQREPMDRVAVITGASRGIGAATALVLADKRFRLRRLSGSHTGSQRRARGTA
jgi:diketogulonate reductase-like aldo/keto reductase